MAERLVYFNGKFIPEQEARISIFDCALMYGDMIFEMTRTFRQKPYRLREHLERLYRSMKYAQIDCGLDIDQMEAATHETIERNLPAVGALDFQNRTEEEVRQTGRIPVVRGRIVGNGNESPPMPRARTPTISKGCALTGAPASNTMAPTTHRTSHPIRFRPLPTSALSRLLIRPAPRRRSPSSRPRSCLRLRSG